MEMEKEPLPEVELYSIGPDEADYAAPLLTGEAVEEIKAGMAFGMALVEEGEVRAAVCARLLPENETHLELVSLYVAPEYRRRGLGCTLLMELLEEMESAMDGMLTYVTAAFSPQMDGLEQLFTRVGFVIEEESAVTSWQIPLKKLMGSPLFARRVSVPGRCMLRTLEHAQDLDLRRLVEKLAQNGVADLTVSQMRQSLTGASYILWDENAEPVACAIVSKQDDTHVYLSQFFTANGNKAAGVCVLQAAADALVRQLPGDVVVEIPTITASSAKLVQHLLPNCQATCVQRAVLDLTKQNG